MSPRDYVAIADDYALAAVADTEGLRYGSLVRAACARYLRDRQRAAVRGGPFTFDPVKATNHCDFIEKMPHVEGQWYDRAGNIAPYIILHPAHVFFVVNIFGFRNHDGTRRFTQALFNVARKNAKSTLAAAIALSCLCLEKEPGPQVVSAATTGAQARIVFDIAKRMVLKTPDLREQFSLEVFANAIAATGFGGSFKPINAKASTQDGLNPSCVVLDEIHAHKTHDLLNVLQSAAGARLNPLWIYTTTEGYESPGPWPEMRRYAEQVLAGLYRDEEVDHFFGIIYTLDDQVSKPGEKDFRPEDDDFDETKWVKANPLLDVNPILHRELTKASNDAKKMPGRHAEFKTKRLNRRAASVAGWLNIPKWKACATPLITAARLREFEDRPCWAGLDGAATTDIMALRLVWDLDDGVVATWGRRWVPEHAVARRTERGTVPYAAWVQSGLIVEQKGRESLDYEIIEDEIVELVERFHVMRLKYDPWNLRDLASRLVKRVPTYTTDDNKEESILGEFRQGYKTYSPAMKATEALYLEGKLQHGGDPVLNWCASNVVPRYDENMNAAPDRKRSADKIDDACALFMAMGARSSAPEPDGSSVQFMFLGGKS